MCLQFLSAVMLKDYDAALKYCKMSEYIESFYQQCIILITTLINWLTLFNENVILLQLSLLKRWSRQNNCITLRVCSLTRLAY